MAITRPPSSKLAPTPPPPTDLKAGVIWNLGSLIFLAVAGFVVNVLIARAYDETILGLFNICFALHIALSQLGAFGLHLSTLQAVSEYAHDDHDQASIAATNAITTGFGTSGAATVVGLALTPIFVSIFDIEGFWAAWLLILPGLFFFSINKVLYAILNGARQMRMFAITQSLRFIFMIGTAVSLVVFNAPGFLITLVLTVSEIALFPVLTMAAVRALHLNPKTIEMRWIRHHLWFGARVFLSGAMLELNSRISVLFIGVQLGAAQTGIYTMAVLIQEGVQQAVFVLRNNINPIIAKNLSRNETVDILRMSRKFALLAVPFFIGCAFFGWLLYPYFVSWILIDSIYSAARAPLTILLSLLAVASPFLIFNQLFSQAKRPAIHTAYMAAVLTANILLNAILIPQYALVGAAIATGATLVVSGAILVLLARIVLKVRILF